MILSKFEDLKQIKFKNQYKLEDALHRTAIVVLSHPFNYCRILIQLGYEPLRPVLVDTLFGGSKYAHPSVFQYIKYIQFEDGVLGLFRGAGHRLCGELTREFFYVNTLHVCKQIDKLQNEDASKKQKKLQSKLDEETSDEDSGKKNKDEVIFSFLILINY